MNTNWPSNVVRVWEDGKLVFDRTTGMGVDKGADEVGQGTGDLCTGFGDG